MKKIKMLSSIVLAGTLLFGNINCNDTNNDPPNVAQKNVPETKSEKFKKQFPERYGRVIYEKNPDAPNQLYFVGMYHPDLITHLEYEKTPEVQTEVYRIGEYLIRNWDVELALAEGGIYDEDYFDSYKKMREQLLGQIPPDKTLDPRLLEDETLINFFRNDSTKVYIATSLLSLYYNLDIQGAEERKFHEEHVKYAYFLKTKRRLYNPNGEVENWLEKARTACILVNAPEVIEREKQKRRIVNRNALFTLGVRHLDELVEWLEKERIELEDKPQYGYRGVNIVLDYEIRGYGVKVIRPISAKDL